MTIVIFALLLVNIVDGNLEGLGELDIKSSNPFVMADVTQKTSKKKMETERAPCNHPPLMC